MHGLAFFTPKPGESARKFQPAITDCKATQQHAVLPQEATLK